MSRPHTVEEDLLRDCEAKLRAIAEKHQPGQYEARLQILEATASLVGGFPISEYFRAFKISCMFNSRELTKYSAELLRRIQATGIPSPLALSALGREPIAYIKRRNTGSYHTDFRLAQRLAKLALPAVTDGVRVIDPACGSGMLLAALTIAVCKSKKARLRSWLRDSVYAADLAPNALRVATACLACFTDDVQLLIDLRSRWIVHDSLMAELGAWQNLAPSGFDIVIANPPWEKVKLTRHEFLQKNGDKRHYGAEYEDVDEQLFESQLGAVESYVAQLVSRYDCLVAEPDLYMAFLQLFLNIVRPGGRISALVPAGLIRSQRTEALRKLIVERSASLTISVIENRARFFSIDTRFKFLAVTCGLSHHRRRSKAPIVLFHERGFEEGLHVYGRARLPIENLRKTRPDLSVPEVRNEREWRLFRDMTSRGVSWETGHRESWRPYIVREVDMTKGKRYFSTGPKVDDIAVVEGRMIQQHRFGAKSYVSGTGRRAIWRNNGLGSSEIAPQFWIDPKELSAKIRDRIKTVRAGFCDITGQTNERSMMAALVPPGVVCGNKVPTISFPDDPSLERLLLWTALVNSLPFDWLMRRVVTTTVNYFVLLSLPLPPVGKETLPGCHLISAAAQLNFLNSKAQTPEDSWVAAELRAQIDTAVLVSYGLNAEDMELMLDDFPLLDRGQPPLPNEAQSTVTRDLLLLSCRRRTDRPVRDAAIRVAHAKALGAIPYIPSQILADMTDSLVDYA